MLIEIDDKYIEWVVQNCLYQHTHEDIDDFVNDVLREHKRTWEDNQDEQDA